jgi:hypothetical protein
MDSTWNTYYSDTFRIIQDILVRLLSFKVLKFKGSTALKCDFITKFGITFLIHFIYNNEKKNDSFVQYINEEGLQFETHNIFLIFSRILVLHNIMGLGM